MTLSEFLKYADEWATLGWAVQEQLHDIMKGDDMAEQNDNALAMIGDFLEDMARECQDAELSANADGWSARIQDHLHTPRGDE